MSQQATFVIQPTRGLASLRLKKLWDSRELALTVLKPVPVTGSRIEFRLLPVDDPKHRRPDLTCARQQLSWEPKIGLDEGLQRTISWFRKESGRA